MGGRRNAGKKGQEYGIGPAKATSVVQVLAEENA